MKQPAPHKQPGTTADARSLDPAIVELVKALARQAAKETLEKTNSVRIR